MNGALAVDLVRQAVMISLMVAAPLLATALLVGIVVSLVQAVTQLQEHVTSIAGTHTTWSKLSVSHFLGSV